MIDTSIWLETREDSGFRGNVSEIFGKHHLMTCEMVGVEMKRAIDFLNEKKMAGAQDLHDFYQGNKGEYVPETDEVKQLVGEYIKRAQGLGLPDGMDADFAIVASASVGNSDIILTLNRKTMASDVAKLVYVAVNSAKGLKTPHFISDRIAIKKTASL